jgi:hypothetical protein
VFEGFRWSVEKGGDDKHLTYEGRLKTFASSVIFFVRIMKIG